MEVSNKVLVITFLCVLVLTGFTVMNIFNFMPDLSTCEDEFALIDRCGCVPCVSSIQNLFNLEGNCTVP